jgi:hypothetical protein
MAQTTPADLTTRNLRKTRRDIAALDRRVERLEMALVSRLSVTERETLRQELTRRRSRKR